MSQVILRNNTGSWSVTGRLVKIDPKDPRGVVYANYTDSGIIGTMASKTPPGNPCKINLINTVNWVDIIDRGNRIFTGSVPPASPQEGDLWIQIE